MCTMTTDTSHHRQNAVPATLRIYLIRHGETAWSLQGLHTGRTDVALTAHGEEQARGLARGLQSIVFAQVWASPSKRAQDTCRLAGLGAQAQAQRDLLEWDYGDYEGLRTAQVLHHRPDWALHRHGCPGGESPAQVEARADRLCARLRALHGNVVLFAHGQFGAVLGARWIGLPVGLARHFPLAPASVSVLSLDPRHPGVPVIALWNALASGRTDALFITDAPGHAAPPAVVAPPVPAGGGAPAVPRVLST